MEYPVYSVLIGAWRDRQTDRQTDRLRSALTLQFGVQCRHSQPLGEVSDHLYGLRPPLCAAPASLLPRLVVFVRPGGGFGRLVSRIQPEGQVE